MNLAKQYLETVEQIKMLEELKESLRKQLIPLDGQSLDGYNVKVTTSISSRVESLKIIEDKSPSLFKALHEAGCVKKIEAQRLSIKPVEIKPTEAPHDPSQSDL